MSFHSYDSEEDDDYRDEEQEAIDESIAHQLAQEASSLVTSERARTVCTQGMRTQMQRFQREDTERQASYNFAVMDYTTGVKYAVWLGRRERNLRASSEGNGSQEEDN